MKVIKKENGIQLIPESDFERDCLAHIADKGNLKSEWDDAWVPRNLEITFQEHKWNAWD